LFVPGTSGLTNEIEAWEASMNNPKFLNEEKQKKALEQNYKRKRPADCSEEDDEPSACQKLHNGLVMNNESILVNSLGISSIEGYNLYNLYVVKF
jgi:hypothetical protein